MKKLILTIILIFFVAFSYAQKKENIKTVDLGSVVEVTVYYDSGQIMQHGFMTKDNKLHASWESYYEDGTKKCVANYDNGYKVGIWYYYYPDIVKRVTYEKNKVVKVEELEPEE